LPGGSTEQLMDSLFNKILPLGDDVEVYSGHGQSRPSARSACRIRFSREPTQLEVAEDSKGSAGWADHFSVRLCGPPCLCGEIAQKTLTSEAQRSHGESRKGSAYA